MSQNSVKNNSMVFNAAKTGSIIDIYLAENPYEFSYNTIKGNVVLGEEPSYSMGISAHPVIRYNNILDNTATYELYNHNGSLTPHLDAKENWWGTTSETEIQGIIYDWIDDAAHGIVDYSPFTTSIRTDAPIAPPSGLTIEQGTGEISLTWNANTEPDLAGYKVHWGASNDYPFENTIDAGNTTFYTITGLTGGDYYVSVTAYDTFADTVADDPGTRVNEIQCAGNESWYAKAVSTLGINEPERGYQDIMAIYPNPTSGNLTVKVPADASEIQVLNPLGQVVYKIRVYDQTTYNIVLKMRGTYFVKVLAFNQTITEKVIVY